MEEAAMGRLVRVPRRAASAIDPAIAGVLDGVPGMSGGTDGELPPYAVVEQDTYLERVAKYTPAEVLGFSVFINAILDQTLRNGGKAAMMSGLPVTTIAGIALLAGMLLSPFFVWYVHEEGDAWITNAFMSFLAFPFWSYALGAVAFADYRDGNLAAILLATFTVVSGLIKPRAPRPRRAHEGREAGAKDGPRLVDFSTAVNAPRA
jgi:hypothetical protein